MDIVRTGIIMLVYVAVIFILYIILSSPFDQVVSSFENINSSASDTYVDSSSGIARTVFDMTFAGLIIVPIIWFIAWIFRREPDWRYYQ